MRPGRSLGGLPAGIAAAILLAACGSGPNSTSAPTEPVRPASAGPVATPTRSPGSPSTAPTRSPAAAQPGTTPAPLPAGSVLVPGTHAALVPPDGFTIADTFPGFQHGSSGSSIMVAELPAPYSDMATGFVDESRLAENGLELTNHEELTVGGRPSVVVEATQLANGITYGKVILVTGTESQTLMVTGAYLADDTTTGAAVREAILTTTFDPGRPADAEAALSFSLAPARPLLFAGVLSNTALYNTSGSLSSGESDEPYMVVAPSLGEPAVPDLAAFARTALERTATLADVAIESSAEVTIAGLPGIALTATANRTTREGTSVAYQVVLSTGTGYVRMIGLCPVERRVECLDLFRRSMETYRPKP